MLRKTFLLTAALASLLSTAACGDGNSVDITLTNLTRFDSNVWVAVEPADRISHRERSSDVLARMDMNWAMQDEVMVAEEDLKWIFDAPDEDYDLVFVIDNDYMTADVIVCGPFKADGPRFKHFSVGYMTVESSRVQCR